MENVANTYSNSNESKYDIGNPTEKHMLCKQFVAWNCNGCSIAPLTDYANSLIYLELPTEKYYFTDADGRLYIDLRDSEGILRS